jgi:hypothetical protein
MCGNHLDDVHHCDTPQVESSSDNRDQDDLKAKADAAAQHTADLEVQLGKARAGIAWLSAKLEDAKASVQQVLCMSCV